MKTWVILLILLVAISSIVGCAQETPSDGDSVESDESVTVEILEEEVTDELVEEDHFVEIGEMI